MLCIQRLVCCAYRERSTAITVRSEKELQRRRPALIQEAQDALTTGLLPASPEATGILLGSRMMMHGLQNGLPEAQALRIAAHTLWEIVLALRPARAIHRHQAAQAHRTRRCVIKRPRRRVYKRWVEALTAAFVEKDLVPLLPVRKTLDMREEHALSRAIRRFARTKLARPHHRI